MFGDFKTSKISELEEKILKYWQEKKVFEKSVNPSMRLRAGRKAPRDYVFYDGPPFATGLPHYGHILASVIKDTIPRYQTMKGFRVERKWGWDCHGLPIENIIEQNLGLKTKKDIEKYGVENFNAAAQKEVLKYVDDWKRIIPRIGRWADMENDYRTMDAEYTESVWWVFKTLYDKKLAYEGYKSMHICPRCETTLSNFEVAQGYKDIEDPSVYVKFRLKAGQTVGNWMPGNKTYFLAWTTTPWTLPGNVALAVGESIEYWLSEKRDKITGDAEELIFAGDSPVAKELGHVGKKFSGRNLIGLQYEPLFDYYANDKKLENRQNGWKIYPADFVKTNEGTGIVHIAPAFGEDDMNLGKKHHLPFVQHVGMDGKFKKEVKDFAGLPAKPKEHHDSTDNKIIEWLFKNKKLFKSEKIVHSYPHCWRCDTPLLNYATSSWFVNVTALKNGKNGLIKNNKKINWVPGHIRDGRFGKILEEAPDWAVSRSRYWGAPLPVWKCPKCSSIKIVGSVSDLKDNSKKSGNNYFLMRHGEALNNVKDISSSSLKNANKYYLTEIGQTEVISAAEKLKKPLSSLSKSKNIDLIFSSPLRRAKETAELVAHTIGLSKKKIIFDKRLIEVNNGIFDGRDVQEYRGYTPLPKKFIQNPPRGENLTEVKNRVAEFLYEVDGKYKSKNILIVGHEYPLWLMIAAAKGADIQKSLGIKKSAEEKNKRGDFLSLAEVTRIDFAPLPHNKNFELDLHRPFIDEVEFNCHCGGKMKRVNYVFDCWFESGSMPYGQSHYPFENKAKFEKNFPAEFIAEGVDQTRGWFYTLLVLSTALFGKPAYKNVIVSGIILAENGQKMSKRLKNYPDPAEIISRYGADALRYYLLSSPVMRAEDLNFSEKGVDEVYKKVILRLANVFNFYEMYADKENVSSKYKLTSKNVLDRWILGRLNQLIGEISAAMDFYGLDRAVRPIGEFVDDLSTWYIRRSRERFRGSFSNSSRIKLNPSLIDKKNAIMTTRFVLVGLAKVIAPFMPFLADWIYLQLGSEESIHLEKWPSLKKLQNNQLNLILKMEVVRKIASLGLEARAKAGIKVRQPLQELKIQNEKSRIKNHKELLAVLADEVNVKKIVFDKNIKDEVELDTKITAELKEEGILREFIRVVQDLRQKAGCTPADRIYLWLEVPKEFEGTLSKNLKVFRERVGAKNIEFKRMQKFDAEVETRIDSRKTWIGIKKI